MKRLDLQFTYDQFQFRQLARANDVVLLEKSKPNSCQKSYEVVIVRKHPAQVIHGRSYPERESMPPTEAWGQLAWSLTDLETAQAKFRRIVDSRQNAPSALTPFPANGSEADEPPSGAEIRSGTSD
ncbi:MAG TPA: hypothetical protein VK615_00160 [Candidatus Binatia bacterium]|nr:hypothetical protein [Candidatus Binatia bacterium]